MSDTDGAEFGVFVSYSHDDAAWARWLTKRLESFRTPRSLVGVEGEFGPVRPLLGRVFRDDEELGASPHLGERIEQALSRSASLVVLCSPAAAASKWVDQEIRQFRTYHPDRPVFAIVVERAADDRPVFPASLRSAVAPGAPLGEEPLAVDFTAQDRRVALLKLASGILGTDFDRLYQRERRRSTQRLAMLAAGACMIAIVLAMLTLVAVNQARLAERNAESALRNERAAAVERDRAVRNERAAATERDRAVKSERRSRELLVRSIASERRAAISAQLARKSAEAERESARRAVQSADQARREQLAAVRAREAAFDALNRTATRIADDRYRENPALAAMQRDVLGELMPVYVRLLDETGRTAAAVASYAQALDGLAGLQADWVSVEQANADYGRLVDALSGPDIIGDPDIVALRDKILLRHAAVLASYGDGQSARDRLSRLTPAANSTPEARCIRFASYILLAGAPTDRAALRDDARDVVIENAETDFQGAVGRIECALTATTSYVANNEFDDAFILSDAADAEIQRLRARYPASATLASLSIRRRLADAEIVSRAPREAPGVPDAPSDVPTRRKLPPSTEMPAYLKQEFELVEKELRAAQLIAPENRKLLEAKFFFELDQSRLGYATDGADPAWLQTAEALIRRDPGSRIIAEKLADGIGGYVPFATSGKSEAQSIGQCRDRVSRAERLSQQLPDAYAAQRLLVVSYGCLKTLADTYPAREDLKRDYLDKRAKMDAAELKLIVNVGTAQSRLRSDLLNRMIHTSVARDDEQAGPALLAQLDAELERYPGALRHLAARYLYIAQQADAVLRGGDSKRARQMIDEGGCVPRSQPQEMLCAALHQELVRGRFGPDLGKLFAAETPAPSAPQYLVGWVGDIFGERSPPSLRDAVLGRQWAIEVFAVQGGKVTALNDLDYSTGALDADVIDSLRAQHAETRKFVELAIKSGVDPIRAYGQYRFGEAISAEEAAKLVSQAKAAQAAAPDAVADPADSDPNRARLGFQYDISNDVPVILSVEKDGPSDRAGVIAGDRIVKVDGKSTYGQRIDDILPWGAEGTKVTLTLTRTALPKPFTVEVVRTRFAPNGLATTEPANSWQSSAFSKKAEPIVLDESLLKETVVILLQGRNIYGDQIYTYLQMTLEQLQKLRDKMRSNEDFMPAEHGTILAAGKGSPSRQTRAWLAKVHNMVDVPGAE